MDIIEIAHGGKPLKLEDRLLKAITNIDKALDLTQQDILNKQLSITGREYLANQKALLQALLASECW